MSLSDICFPQPPVVGIAEIHDGTLSQRLQASLAIESGRNSVSNASARRGRPLARMLGFFMSQKRRSSRQSHDLRLLGIFGLR